MKRPLLDGSCQSRFAFGAGAQCTPRQEVNTLRYKRYRTVASCHLNATRVVALRCCGNPTGREHAGSALGWGNVEIVARRMASLKPWCTDIAVPLVLQIQGIDRQTIAYCFVRRGWVGLWPKGIGLRRNSVAKIPFAVLAKGCRVG